MSAGNCPYQDTDSWELSRRSTDRINRLNDIRRQFVRLEIAANTLLNEYYKNDTQEKQLAALLYKVATVARARAIGIDEETTEALVEHERIMSKLLRGE